MELYHLRTFVTVANEGHLTRAADRLYTSQPAVSAHIKALEEELGVTLFLRTPKGMVLTREGDRLRGKALEALAGVDRFHLEAAQLKENVIGTARIGLHIDPKYLRIDSLLSVMRRKYPDVDFHLLQKWSYEQPSEFKRGRLDAGFVYGRPEAPELAVKTLQSLNVMVVAPVAWKERIKDAGWKEIAAMPWIWSPPECNFCKVASAAFKCRGLSPNVATLAEQEPVLKALVCSGVGLAYMIEEEAMDAKDQGQVAVWDEVLGTMDLSFVYPQSRSADPLVQALRQGIQEVWKVEINP